MLTPMLSLMTFAVLSRSSHAAYEPQSRHAFIEANEVRESRRRQFWDAKKGTDPAPRCKYESFIATRPPRGKVALTFDDGPSKDLTPWILATLAKYHVPATFFLMAERASHYPALVTRIARAGHVIGNHSWEHPNFHALDLNAQRASVDKADAFLNSVMGSFKLFRYPYGNSTCQTNARVRELGYGIVGWHQDSCDWAFDRRGTVDERDAELCDVAPANQANYVGHVVKTVSVRRGGILLLHEIHRNTIRQLEEIIVGLQQAGYTFVTLADPEMRTQIH